MLPQHDSTKIKIVVDVKKLSGKWWN